MLWLEQARGTSAAATCLKFKTPPAASLYVGIPQILIFWIYKIKSPSLCFGILKGMFGNIECQLPKTQESQKELECCVRTHLDLHGDGV